MNKWDSLIKAFEIIIENSTFEELKSCVFKHVIKDCRDGRVRNLKGFKYGFYLPKIVSDSLKPTYYISYKNLDLYEISNMEFNRLTQFINKHMSEKSKINIDSDWNEINEILNNEGK